VLTRCIDDIAALQSEDDDRELEVFGCSGSNPVSRDHVLECTPAGGQGQAADLTICRACSCSNLTGLRYPSAEWSRLLL
jgi:hypothetical protein